MDEVKDRICNVLIVLAMLALVGAGFREYLIHNGRLTSDMNADGHSITNLPGGFFPVESVNGMTGAVTVPPTSLKPATNYTDAALGAFAETGTVERARSYGTPTRWTDATGCVWEVVSGWLVYTNSAVAHGWLAYQYATDSGPFGNAYELRIRPSEGTDDEGYAVASHTFPDGVQPSWSNEYEKAYNSDAEFYGLSYGDEIRILRGATNFVGRVAMTNDIPEAPDMSGYATLDDVDASASNSAERVASPIRRDISDLRTESSLVYRLYQGSNVVAEVTNYNSQVNAPELKIMQLNESNEYVTVWAETNGLARTLARAKEYADGAIADRAAPRAWSGVTAGMGVEAPSNTTWLSTGRTVIAGGLEYEKHLTSGGAIWLLESNGMAADFHPQTNNTAFIDLSNADGTPIFRVEKTDSFLVGVHVDSVTVDGDALVCGVGVVASEHPLVRVRASLTSGDWSKEEDGIPASLATVTWSGTAGNWTCRIQNNTGGGSFFAQMEYFQEGGTKIVNSAALDVSAGILCTDGIHKVRPVYNNGNITWEVLP